MRAIAMALRMSINIGIDITAIMANGTEICELARANTTMDTNIENTSTTRNIDMATTIFRRCDLYINLSLVIGQSCSRKCYELASLWSRYFAQVVENRENPLLHAINKFEVVTKQARITFYLYSVIALSYIQRYTRTKYVSIE